MQLVESIDAAGKVHGSSGPQKTRAIRMTKSGLPLGQRVFAALDHFLSDLLAVFHRVERFVFR